MIAKHASSRLARRLCFPQPSSPWPPPTSTTGTAEFRALYTRVLTQLKQFVGTQTGDIIILSSSGTGAMEAAVSNLTSPGDRVLVLTGRQVRRALDRPRQGLRLRGRCRLRAYGKTFSLDEVKAALKLETRAIFMQATETSTGVRHCVPGRRQAVERDQLRGAAGGRCHYRARHTHLEMDEWGVRCTHRRLAEGGHDSTRALVPGRRTQGSGPHEARLQPAATTSTLRKERKNARAGESATRLRSR